MRSVLVIPALLLALAAHGTAEELTKPVVSRALQRLRGAPPLAPLPSESR